LGSEHLPIDINFVNNIKPASGTNYNPIRTRLSLNHLDGRCFALLVANHMSSIPVDIEAVQQYERWHSAVIECSLLAGGSVIYNNGTCKRFDFKHNRIIHHDLKQHRKQVNVKPWWDKDCQEAVDARRKCYKEFLKRPDKVKLSQYRKAQNARNVIKTRKKVNFNKFVDELDPSNNPKNFWKVVKLFRNSVVFNSDHPPSKSSWIQLGVLLMILPLPG